MILTCPACGTQYVVKDGAIPPQGRQVRCASCKHSWHQDPEQGDADGPDETLAEASVIEPRSGPEAEERAYETAGDAPDGPADEPPGYAPVDPAGAPREPASMADTEARPPVEAPEEQSAEVEEPHDYEFSPFAQREPEEERRRRPLVSIILFVLVIAALAAAFWFLAPPAWKERVGIASSAETPLQLMMTHSDRQKLASGNELLAVTGRVINPTDESQTVPPIQAELRTRSGQLVYSWTIAPPARSLPPGASATFNSAEVNVPAGGDELTITLGSKA